MPATIRQMAHRCGHYYITLGNQRRLSPTAARVFWCFIAVILTLITDLDLDIMRINQWVFGLYRANSIDAHTG